MMIPGLDWKQGMKGGREGGREKALWVMMLAMLPK